MSGGRPAQAAIETRSRAGPNRPNGTEVSCDASIVYEDVLAPSPRSRRATIPEWNPGPTVGPNTVDAVVESTDPVFGTGGKYHDKYDLSLSANILSVVVTATGTVGPPTTMVVAATPTHGVAGQAVTPAPSVKITDAHDNPLAGIGVSFVALDGGSVSGGVPVTDAAGVATVGGWTLSGSAISQQLVATANATGINGSPLDFVVQAVAGAAAKVTATTPVAIGIQPSTAVSPSPTVKVADAHDNPIAGLAVTFAVGSTGGVVTGGSQTTNALGLATVGGWTVGSTINADYTLVATVAGNGITNNPMTFTAHTSSGLSLAISAGNNQSAIVNSTVQIDPQVRVTDLAGAGVAGVVINWTVAQGTGSFLPLTSITDAQGYATLDCFGPTAVGQIRLRASTTDSRVQPKSVDFSIRGLPEP